jgi:3-oxoacyl-[acyl-carrier protein] reductase
VAFGFIETRLTLPADDPASKIEIAGLEIQAGVPAAALASLTGLVPLGRAGTAAEAAGGVYLFCIPESDYISGQVITVGGGVSI